MRMVCHTCVSDSSFAASSISSASDLNVATETEEQFYRHVQLKAISSK